MRRAIALSQAAIEYATGGAFGALIVKDGQIIAEGMNRVIASHDPTGTWRWRPSVSPLSPCKASS